MNWKPLDGEIPPDPPDAPWRFEPGDSPAQIIHAMREVWHLAKGGTPEHAQALFDVAGQWLDYWRQARASADDLDRAGIHLPESPNGRIPDGAVAPTAILAIYAAHQAILTGRRALLGIARELASAALLQRGAAAAHAAAEGKKRLARANDKRSNASKDRDRDLKEAALEQLAKKKKRHQLASILARREWPDARNPQSATKVRLTADHIRGLLQDLLDE